MVKHNLSFAFDFYYITDDTKGLDTSIKALPLYDESLTGWWHRLSIFRKDFNNLSGTELF
jgi:hypothetical protein